jgi:hypothetical protein
MKRDAQEKKEGTVGIYKGCIPHSLFPLTKSWRLQKKEEYVMEEVYGVCACTVEPSISSSLGPVSPRRPREVKCLP